MFRNINWKVLTYFLVVHVAAIVLATLYFTWTAFWLWIGLTVFFCLMITMWFHRKLAHGGFNTSSPLHYVFTTLGMLAGEGPPMIWVANHRKHHQYSDQEGDPHSPRDGFGHSHIWWMTYYRDPEELDALFRRYVGKDLLQDPYMRFLNWSYIWWHIAFAALTLGVGWWLGGFHMGMSFLAWAFFLRMLSVWHFTWFVNSATHIWGYRNYETKDNSRNLWWVAIITLGEGWHNNHHAHPTCTWHGHKPGELDFTGRVIWLLKKLHMVWDVKDKIPDR